MSLHETIIITGASSGLGAQLAQQLAHNNINLVLFARSAERLANIEQICRSKGAHVLSVVGDVGCATDCQRLVDQTVARFKGIDCLINNAGMSMWAKFSEMNDLGVFETLMRVNYLGNVYCCHHALPHLKRSCGQIVCVSSLQGRFGVPYHSGYCASKHALQGFYDALRLELGRQVSILMVYPTWMAGTNLRKAALNSQGESGKLKSHPHAEDALDVTVCAEKIIKGMRLRREELTLPGHYRVLFVLRVLARRVLGWLLQRKFSHQ